MSKDFKLLQMTAATIHDVRNVVSALVGTQENLAEEMSSMQAIIFRMIETLPNFSIYTYLVEFSKRLDTYAVSFSQLKSGTDRLKKMANNYLDLAKMQAGKFEVNPVSFEIKAPLEELLKQKSSDIKNKSIKISYEHPFEKIQIIADQNLLYRILLNLFSNALQYTPNGGTIKVTIEENTAKEQGKIEFRFAISDTGEGMDLEQQSRLFQPFSQTKKEHSKKGTGLGLVTAKEFVEMMGGKIGVESERGKGSTFFFTLVCDRDLSASQTKKPKQKIKLASKNTGMQVLIAEDNPINQKMLKIKLANAGYTVFVANNGEEALNILMQNPSIAIVLMDIQMPKMDGLEATREWRAYEEKNLLSRKHIIALSGDTGQDCESEALKAGMDVYLTKGDQDVLKIVDKFKKHNEKIKSPVTTSCLDIPVENFKQEVVLDEKAQLTLSKTGRHGFPKKSFSESSFQDLVPSSLQSDLNDIADKTLQKLFEILCDIPCPDNESKKERSILLNTFRAYDKLVGQKLIIKSDVQLLEWLLANLGQQTKSVNLPSLSTLALSSPRVARTPNLFNGSSLSPISGSTTNSSSSSSSSSSTSSSSSSSSVFNFGVSSRRE